MLIEISEGKYTLWWQGIIPKHIAITVNNLEVFVLTEGGYSDKLVYERIQARNSGRTLHRWRWRTRVFGIDHTQKGSI